MKSDVNVIWREGDGEIPPKARHVIDAVRGEMLLESLGLPEDVANEIRYNADKNSQSISHYISNIVLERLRTA
jgi:hypothetical protein